MQSCLWESSQQAVHLRHLYRHQRPLFPRRTNSVATVATTPPPLTDPALTGTWTYKGAMFATGIRKIPVISNTQSITLTFNNDGTLAGFSGCNNFNGSYTLSGKTTEFGKEISFSGLLHPQRCIALIPLISKQHISIISRKP